MGFIRNLSSQEVKEVAKNSGFDIVKIISNKVLNVEGIDAIAGMCSVILLGKVLPKRYFYGIHNLDENYEEEIKIQFLNCPQKVLEKITSSGAITLQISKDIREKVGLENQVTELLGLRRVRDSEIFISSELGVPLQIELILTDIELESDLLDIWKDEQMFRRDNLFEDMVVATLGPAGTCSENASMHYIQLKKGTGQVKLYASFEDAVEAVINKEADYMVVPSAYRKLADIIFQKRLCVEIVDVFQMETPGLVIADKGKGVPIRIIASHSSPLGLAKEYFGSEVEYVISKSNGDSAKLLLDGKVDACITTVKCVNLYNLNVVFDFGPISMGWNVMKRKKINKERSV